MSSEASTFVAELLALVRDSQEAEAALDAARKKADGARERLAKARARAKEALNLGRFRSRLTYLKDDQVVLVEHAGDDLPRISVGPANGAEPLESI